MSENSCVLGGSPAQLDYTTPPTELLHTFSGMTQTAASRQASIAQPTQSLDDSGDKRPRRNGFKMKIIAPNQKHTEVQGGVAGAYKIVVQIHSITTMRQQESEGNFLATHIHNPKRWVVGVVMFFGGFEMS